LERAPSKRKGFGRFQEHLVLGRKEPPKRGAIYFPGNWGGNILGYLITLGRKGLKLGFGLFTQISFLKIFIFLSNGIFKIGGGLLQLP